MVQESAGSRQPVDSRHKAFCVRPVLRQHISNLQNTPHTHAIPVAGITLIRYKELGRALSARATA